MSHRLHGALAVAGAGFLALFSPSSPAQQPAESTLGTILVTADRDELELEQLLTPGSVTTLDGEALYTRSVSNFSDLLRYVPGVWADSSSGSDELFFSSRGSNLDATDYDKNGVKLLQDGLPVTAADGNNHNRVLDPLSARYATIAHGANALTYGASTLGGAIDFTSPTALNSDALALFTSGGSHGQLNGRLSGGLVSDDLDGLGTVEAKNWDGYRQHSAQERIGLYANAGWQATENMALRLFATWLQNDEQLPGALTRDEVEEDPDQASAAALNGNFQKNVDTWRLAAKATWSLGERSSLEVGLSWEAQSLFHPIVDQIMVDFDGPGPAQPVEVFSLLVDTDQRNAGASLRYRLETGDHQLLLGLNYGDSTVEGGNYRNLHGQPNGLSESVDESADNLELFAVDRWRFASAWTLVYGAQVVAASREVRTVDAGNGDVRNPQADYSTVNPRLGLIWSVDEGHEIYASLSRLYEPPTNFEIEDDVRGNNETLDAMHGEVLEVGLRGNSDAAARTRWHWDVSAYYARIRDEILSVDDPLAPGNSLTTNVDRTTHAGIEALLGASFALGDGRHRVEPLVSFTLNEFSFDSDPVYGNNTLPAAPGWFARGEILYRHGNFSAGPTFDVVGRRYADFANSYAVDSYGLLGLRASYVGERWEVFGELRNLLDEDYIATVGVLNEAGPDARVLNPGAPLSVYVGARLRL